MVILPKKEVAFKKPLNLQLLVENYIVRNMSASHKKREMPKLKKNHACSIHGPMKRNQGTK